QDGRVKIIKPFLDFADNTNPYMYHCHILEHEDRGMMGQYIVVDDNVTTGFVDDKISKIAFYPNPAQNEITISLEALVSDNYTIKILNRQGKEIKTLFSDFLLQGAHELRFELNSLTKGLYFIAVQSKQKAVFNKIILE
ncbi:MAG: T9SS type A sorting domain-containing protein, partial [Gammaproteobacteria bacterium]